MEKTAKYIVFRHKESGAYLTEYKNEGTLAYEANFIKQIRHAKTMGFEAFEEQREKVELLARAMDCEILVVEATYDLKRGRRERSGTYSKREKHFRCVE